jgi:hypothetical protein
MATSRPWNDEARRRPRATGFLLCFVPLRFHLSLCFRYVCPNSRAGRGGTVNDSEAAMQANARRVHQGQCTRRSACGVTPSEDMHSRISCGTRSQRQSGLASRLFSRAGTAQNSPSSTWGPDRYVPFGRASLCVRDPCGGGVFDRTQRLLARNPPVEAALMLSALGR